MILAVIFCVVTVILCLIQIPEYRYLQNLRRSGTRAQGILTRSELHSGRGAGSWVMFSYEVNRVVHEVFQEISTTHYQQLEGRSQVNIAYLPGRENAARLADQDEDWTGFNKNLRLTIVMACAAVLFFLMALSGNA